MSWVQSTLGEVADIFSGYAFKSADMNSEGGTPLIKIKNIADSAVSRECDAFLNKDFNLAKFERFHLLRDDFLVAMTGQGSVGRIGKMRDYKPGFYVNQRVAIVRVNPEKANPVFIFYQIATRSNELELFKKANGAGQPNISAKQIGELPVVLPSTEQQQYIADVLSSYDDLIKNNQKQIKLLEEAAQRLYKEWFVDLRVPGHETTHIVDGIPEGWKKVFLGGICTLKKDAVPAGRISTGTPYIGLEHMPRVDFCLSSWGSADDVISNKFRYAEDDIIFGKIRPYFHKVGFALNNGVVSTDSFVMKANDGIWGLLLMTVFDRAFVDYTYQTCKEGSKMPRADWNQMEKYPVLIPSEKIRQDFEKFIWNITRQVKTLALQNHALTEARDRLLPKLMSGEIEV